MRALRGLAALTIMLAAGAAAQMQDEYLDIGINKIKPDRRADFDALNKKIVDANRRHKGDLWLAYQVEYGEQNTVYFVATRKNMAAIDQGFTAFMAAMKEAFGQAGTDKMLQDVNSCLISSQAEIRRRRWDLSYNVPQDAAALSKLIGESRWIRSSIVHVRPGHNDAFEEQVRAIKQAGGEQQPRLNHVGVTVGHRPARSGVLLQRSSELARGLRRSETL
jgi:quinol monooxygenase YgiN